MSKAPLPAVAAIVVWLAACGGNSVPSPNAPEPEQRAKCEAISADQAVGCKACAGVSFCGWRQKDDSPTDGTCHYLDAKQPDASLVADPSLCPTPPQ